MTGTRDGARAETVGEPERIRVGIAEYAVTTDDAVLSTSGLGSCVGVGLYDPRAGVAGLAHVMLPSADGVDVANVGKYADTGIEALVRVMEDEGATPGQTVAKIAGGSSMMDESSIGEEIGRRNVEAVRSALGRTEIRIVEEDVGGSRGRSLELDATTGDLLIRTAGGDARTI